MNRLPLILLTALALVAVGTVFFVIRPFIVVIPNPIAPPAAFPAAQPYEAIMGKALAAYNARDERAFFADFASSAVPPATPEVYRALFEGFYKEKFGTCLNRKLSLGETEILPDRAVSHRPVDRGGVAGPRPKAGSEKVGEVATAKPPHPVRPGRSPAAEAVPAERTVRRLRMVKLFLATDRKWTGSDEQPKWFGPKWNGRELTYGTCVVSIPPKHQPGAVEKPSIFRFELKEDAEDHVVVHQPKRLDEAPYFAALRTELGTRPQKEITVFVHGFNNTFDAAASRLAVLAYDMDFNGVPILYSWSSQGGGWGAAAYARDEEVVDLTIRPLAGFLAKVADAGRTAGATRVNVVAHSMGNRALVAALELLAQQQPGKLLLDEVVMAAPDVKAIGFPDGVWPHLKTPAKRYTLYASDDDKALIASKKIHTWSRIGQAGEDLLLLDGLDTVDATGCDFSMLGLNHSYFGSPQVVEDLKALLSKALTPAARKLREKKRQTLLYWLLPEVTPPNLAP